MDWTVLFGGLGIGSLLGIVAQNYFSKKAVKEERFYQEKKETYLGLLDAIHRAAVSPGDANSKDYALWQTRVDLFGSEGVAKAAQGIVDTNDGPRGHREQVYKELVREMRKDLKE